MKIYDLGRGQGKTTRLLYASEFNDIPILCTTKDNKYILMERAKMYGLDIPEPITVNDIVSSSIRCKDVINKDMLVDEAPAVLQSLLSNLGIRGEVKAITLTSK